MAHNFYKILRRGPARIVIGALMGLSMINLALAETTIVTLKDGTEYEIETIRGLPKPFENDYIRVRDLGLSVSINRDNLDAPPFVRVLIAELRTEGEFTVTITTPLDSTACMRLEAKGPGIARLNFFPQADYPLVWEGIDQPGIHWFPFHFVFEDKHSEDRFEFTQWAQMDSTVWKRLSDSIKKDIQRLRRKK